MMERLGTIFLVAGLGFFTLAFIVMAVLPWMSLRDIPMLTIEEIAQNVSPEFYQMAESYPEEFELHFGGGPGPETFAEALRYGRDMYIAEACWHCHSQYVRPVSNESTRWGPVSSAEEHQTELQLPQLLGTRRVGPDLSRQAGLHTNDWHIAHLFNPRSVVPTSIMPSFPWFFDEERRPNKKGMAVVTYIQWLGSSVN